MAWIEETACALSAASKRWRRRLDVRLKGVATSQLVALEGGEEGGEKEENVR